MGAVEHLICLPPDYTARTLRSEGRRFGAFKGAQAADLLMRYALLDKLDDARADSIYAAISGDIAATMRELEPVLSSRELRLFDRAARRAWRRRMSEGP